MAVILSGIKTLKEITGGISNKEVKNQLNEKIADLLDVVLNARIQMVEMQEKYEQVVRENRELKEARAPREKPKMKWGCYIFEGDPEGMYCTACYDTTGKKIQTTRLNSRFRQCAVCKALLGA
jgi:hypothetical protein